MDDYIKREDAIAYPLSWDHYDKKNGNRHFIAGVESYREYVEDLPTADVAEVVRCKDCKYSSPDKVYGCRFEPFNTLENGERMYSNDYCSYGERTDT